ncbi:hypothetical protein HANVADRAFT_54312 [Hanseniaspora valbyensis NRRL Y-1626]|uniref:Dynein light chain n=1 Tax=Hanseniaspora valbyensis NRRL Y-1626 TaxID=766949 RepID=A0A1B7T7N8_9ASCO|nr:hypothetical protein HANVADRAFT_54312 [Hanseniaspora valbyensis NRRL Y-1626]
MTVNVSEIDPKISVKSSDLINDELEEYILKLVSKTMSNFSFENTNETDIAKDIKLDLDSYTQKNATKGYWCVVVGRNFGSYMSYEKGYFIHLCYSNISFQIFKMA